MTVPLRFTILLCIFVFVASKQLHEKLTLEAKDKDEKGFMNLFNNQDEFIKNERIHATAEVEIELLHLKKSILYFLQYARHVKAVSESVIDHLLNEIKQQYRSPNYNSNSPIPRLIKNLNKELKRNEQIKLQKEKEKRKGVKKNKRNNNRRTRVTTKTN
ncbi:uncharacterized protein LOC118270617 isoform X1 [Spodoptera frugiperda]|uniref:Uncharacterized protein LOC118270617 isoform X1 n=1 Tax=Spodoptera frugiperda TaxID=7108 RepID=A0A9R0EL43_SPOFR|nr:uncharacterized protein LOC118270617 isoform X1 [Spodoptera frugiperda]